MGRKETIGPECVNNDGDNNNSGEVVSTLMIVTGDSIQN